MAEFGAVMRDISGSVGNQNVKRSKDSEGCAYVDTERKGHSVKIWVRGFEM